MTNKQFLDVFGDISDEFIYEAAPSCGKKNNNKLLIRIVSIAACLALVVGGAFAINALLSGRPVVYTDTSGEHTTDREESSTLLVTDSSDPTELVYSNDSSGSKPEENIITFNSVTEYFPVSNTAEYGADAVLPDYFPVIYTANTGTREYVGTTVPLDEAYIDSYYSRGIYKTVEVDGIDPDTKAPVTKNVDLYLIDGMTIDFALAAKFEGDSNYYTYINILHNSLSLTDLFADISDKYTVLENVEKDDGSTVSEFSMSSDEVMNVWNTLFDEDTLNGYLENRCKKYGYEEQEKDLRGTVYTMSFYINEINLPSKVTFGLNDELTVTIGTVVYDFFAEDETIRKCIKLIDPDADLDEQVESSAEVTDPAENDTLESITLTDEQKQVLTTLYEDYTKPAYVFFNRNFEVKDVPEMFKGTQYEFERVTLTEDELPEELIKICDEDPETHSYPGSFIKYTGSAVNTKEKLKNEMSKYFTDKFINNALGTENPDDPHFYSWEQDGAVYRQCPEGGMTLPLSDGWKLYVKEYTEDENTINVKLLCDPTAIQEGWTKSYYYITLEKEADGGFKLDDFYTKTVYTDGEERINFMVHHFYSKGTLIF